jgi:hypothetical protein
LRSYSCFPRQDRFSFLRLRSSADARQGQVFSQRSSPHYLLSRRAIYSLRLCRTRQILPWELAPSAEYQRWNRLGVEGVKCATDSAAYLAGSDNEIDEKGQRLLSA